MDHRQAEQPPEPHITRSSEPDCDRAINANAEFALCVHGVQPATHILDPNTEARKRVRFDSYITKFDNPGPGRANEPTTLPRDA